MFSFTRTLVIASLSAFAFSLVVSFYLSAPQEVLAAGCLDKDCMERVACTESTDPWDGEDTFWFEVFVQPATRNGRLEKLVWEPASGEFQPFQYTANWGLYSESVYIGADGAETASSPSHPNIRYHTSSVLLCDGFTPVGPRQITTPSSSSSSGCIEAVVYNFDVREFHNGNSSRCLTQVYGYADSENTDLDAIDPDDCGDTSPPTFTFGTQKNQELECHTSVYHVIYTE